MGELFNALGQDVNTAYTTYAINNSLCAWVDTTVIPDLDAGRLKFNINLKDMTYTLVA